MHIFTIAPPCMNKVADNNNLPCIVYYESLTKFMPNVHFYVYFCYNQLSLSPKSVQEGYISLDTLIYEVVNMVNDSLKYCLSVTKSGKPSLVASTCESISGLELYGMHWQLTNKGNENHIVKALNSKLKDLIPSEVECTFNKIFNVKRFPNLHYHCI